MTESTWMVCGFAKVKITLEDVCCRIEKQFKWTKKGKSNEYIWKIMIEPSNNELL